MISKPKAIFMKGIIRMAFEMVQDDVNMQMVMCMKGIERMTRKRTMAYANMQMVMFV